MPESCLDFHGKHVSLNAKQSQDGESDSDRYSYTSTSASGSHNVFSSSQSSSSSNSESSSVGDCVHRAGGVLCTIKRTCFSANARIESKVWVPGRILKISIFDNDKTFTFINVHFFGLQPNQVAQFSSHLKNLHQQTKLDPTKRFVTIVGDFNIRFEGDAMIELGTGKPIQRAKNRPKWRRS